MSQHGEKYVCDRDGVDVGNGGILEAVVVSDINEETGMVVNLHFCRDQKDEEGKIIRKGCSRKILSPSNIQHYRESNEQPAQS